VCPIFLLLAVRPRSVRPFVHSSRPQCWPAGLLSFKSKLNKSFTRRTSGHCLGTFQIAKLCFDYTPLQNGSVSHYPPPKFLLSLSVSLSVLAYLYLEGLFSELDILKTLFRNYFTSDIETGIGCFADKSR
jgi:hypothetical protein